MSDCARLFAIPRRPSILRHTMLRIGLLALFAAICLAQNNPFNKPPADVDAALRARITEFYDYHVKGQFRKADELVAEDTKEYYFESRKPQYLSFEISRI